MMTAIRSSKLVGPISIYLAVIMTLVLFVPTSALPLAEAANQSRLLLFPVLDRSESPHGDIIARATDYFQMAINEIEEFEVLDFSRTSPLVMRAVEEGRIRAVDVAAEIDDPATALELGFALNAAYVALITIESLTVHEDPPQVELLASGQVFNVAENVDPVSQQSVAVPRPSNTFGVSGRSRVREGYDGATAPLVREALRDAAQRAAEALSGRPPVEVVEEREVRRERQTWQWVAAAALLVGLIIAADNGNDAVTPTDPQAVAPQPLPMSVEANAIRLRWQPPQTDLRVLRYDLQRSTDDGRTWNAVPDSRDNVPGTVTEFADFNVQRGVSYQYRIRAQYAETGPSAWVRFGTVQFHTN